ncbi:MAG: 50S ribosomal protein L9 [Holosporales bacterium]|jgi:large subunit ribosomal protein L9|nr:50S ribosomal protein L9 [Holosporales bacterium]
MKVILLSRVENLGSIGNVVSVKDGYARNFLLPKKKALRASKSNLEYLEKQRTVFEAENLKKKNEAEEIAARMDNVLVSLIRQAGEAGNLFGSVRSADIAEAVGQAGYKIHKSQVCIKTPIKMLGLHTVKVELHPEVHVDVKVNVAQTAEEAEAQLVAYAESNVVAPVAVAE